MNPLGIVNTLEIGFAAAFVILLIWSLGNYLYVSFGNLHMHGAGEKMYVFTFPSKLSTFSLHLYTRNRNELKLA